MFRVARPHRSEGDPRYRLLEPIGEDVSGRLWQAEDSVTGRPIAIKVIKDHLGRDPVFVERLRSAVDALTRPVIVDGRLAHRLSHPNVARVLGLHMASGDRPWVVMESLEGRLLGDVLQSQGALGMGEAARIGSQLAQAIGAAHEVGIVHGGVQPGSVLLRAPGTSLLLDFGVTPAFLSSRSPIELVGPLSPYLGPERDRAVEPAAPSDVYSLGALLVAMLTGCSMPESLAPPTPSGNLPDEMVRAWVQALATDPSARPSALALGSLLSTAAATLPFDSDPWIPALPETLASAPPQRAMQESRPPIAPLDRPPGGPAFPQSRLDSRISWTPRASDRQRAWSRDPGSPVRQGPPIQPFGPPARAKPRSGPPPPIFEPIDPSALASPPESKNVRTSREPRSGARHPLRHLRVVRLVHRLRRKWTSRRRAAIRAAASMAHGTRHAGSKARWAIAHGGRRLSRPPAVWYASAAAALLVAAILLVLVLAGGERTGLRGPAPRQPAPAAPTTASPIQPAAPSLTVPAVVGLTALEARERLTQLGLVVARVEPTLGVPGIVLRTDPASGVQVARGDSITLFVGAPRSRVDSGG